MSESRIPVTGGASRFPVVDRHGTRIHVGDRLRAAVCVGPYGQTRLIETTVEKAHWQWCQLNPEPGCVIGTRYDPADGQLHCQYTHHDYEHGHETWAEIIHDDPP